MIFPLKRERVFLNISGPGDNAASLPGGRTPPLKWALGGGEGRFLWRAFSRLSSASSCRAAGQGLTQE